GFLRESRSWAGFFFLRTNAMAQPTDNSKMSNEAPRLSLILLTYNQERFVAAAVKSALEQVGVTLQIVISDDNSPDKTFEVIQETVRDYKGPHQVVLNRNPKNLGLTGNLNHAWSLTTGEFVIVQAGDDLSVPDRALKMTNR